jgi:hypothetical protein
MMTALRETRGVVVVPCLHCGHEDRLSQNVLTRFGLNPKRADSHIRQTPSV